MEMKVYGPYTRLDGRKHVIHYDGITRRTQSYPRFLMEEYLGRELEDWEEVDHINDDFTDDRIENLQLLTKALNIKKSAKTEIEIFKCPTCSSDFEYEMRYYRYRQVKNGMAGPYCSRSCAGKAHN